MVVEELGASHTVSIGKETGSLLVEMIPVLKLVVDSLDDTRVLYNDAGLSTVPLTRVRLQELFDRASLPRAPVWSP